MMSLEVAQMIRAECLAVAAAAYQDAGLQGLCAEGRWKAAYGAVQKLDLKALLDVRDLAAESRD